MMKVLNNLFSLSEHNYKRRPAKAAAPKLRPVSARPPAKTLVVRQTPSVEKSLLHQGELSRARCPGVHTEIQKLDASSSAWTFLLAPPHAHGAYGNVSYALGPNRGRYAAKSVFTQASHEQVWSGLSVMSSARAEREVGIAQNIDSAVGSVAAVRTPNQLVHVMQLMDGAWSSMPREPNQTGITRSVEGFLRGARGLATFHRSGVLHGDIKLDNLFWSQRGIIKWGDYGVSEALGSRPALRGRRGTPFAMAPEVTLGHDFHLSADMWSFGITLGEMFVGISESPFRLAGDHRRVLDMKDAVVDEMGRLQVTRLLHGQDPMHKFFAHWYVLSPVVCRFAIEELFVRDADKRATASHASTVAKKLVASLPDHAKQAKRAMASASVPNASRERTFAMLEEAWTSSVSPD